MESYLGQKIPVHNSELSFAKMCHNLICNLIYYLDVKCFQCLYIINRLFLNDTDIENINGY